MKKIFFLIFLSVLCNFIFAHDINYEKVILKKWSIEKEHKTIEGSFYMLKNGNVFIEDANRKIISFPLYKLSKEDQDFAKKKNDWVKQLNNQRIEEIKKTIPEQTILNYKYWLLLILIIALASYVFLYVEKNKVKYFIPVFIVGISMTLYSFTNDAFKTTTSPTTIDDAFDPFKPYVNTFWDSTYFYVESKGIPTTHEMMVGISNHGWQQQVPIPQCYTGTNSWSIPLNPVMASVPIPVDSIHFTRGAIALAVNGVPIFNVHTNTGVDSYLDGQLDNYGGHCGRADDYHYHIAPLHLYAHTIATLPIAYALDGYAVYGSSEPDGTTMKPLDANHGHSYTGVYHYHGTSTAPYMIANMAGVVTEDGTHQLIPQAAAHPVRPSLTPLNGALITACNPNATDNGYTIIYTLSGQTDSIQYNWNTAGLYTFNFFTAGNGTSTTSTYNGFVQCDVVSSINNVNSNMNIINVSPNPNNGLFHINLNNTFEQKNIHTISIYNIQGDLLYRTNKYQEDIELKNISSGIYYLKLEHSKGQITKKIVVQ
ncbi:MAG: T9SS type A sorting domain-containing protein [Bacteroidota bacterium]